MEGLTCKPICEKLQFSNDVDWLGRYAAVPSLSMVPNCGMVKFHGLLMFIHIKGRVMNPLTVFFLHLCKTVYPLCGTLFVMVG